MGYLQAKVGAEVAIEGSDARYCFSNCSGGSCVFRLERVFSKEEPVLDGEAGQLSGSEEYSRKHGAVQAPSIGVAQGWVVAGEKMQSVGKDVLSAVSEPIGRLLLDNTSLQQMGQVTVEGDLPKTDDDTDSREGLNLLREVSGTVANLLRGGFVAGWSATDDRGDPGVAKLEAVVARGAC